MIGSRVAKYLLVFLVVWATVANGEVILEGSEEDIAAIGAVFDVWGKARDAGDIDGILSVHHPEMLIMTRNQALYRGHAGVRDFYAKHYGSNSKRQLLSDVMEMRVVGDLAVVIGRFLVLDTDLEDPGYYLILLRRENEGWLIYRDIDTPSPDGLELRAPE